LIYTFNASTDLFENHVTRPGTPQGRHDGGKEQLLGVIESFLCGFHKFATSMSNDPTSIVPNINQSLQLDLNSFMSTPSGVARANQCMLSMQESRSSNDHHLAIACDILGTYSLQRMMISC
jgi:hypothetical protein